MNTKSIILLVAATLHTGCWMRGSSEEAVDLDTFSRVTGISVPSATNAVGIKSPSDAFGDHSLILKFSADVPDITNLVGSLPISMETNWTKTTTTSALSIDEPTNFIVPAGSLSMSVERTGYGFTISIDTNVNEVVFSLGAW